MNELALNFDPFPELHTGRLLLRRIVNEDAPEIYRMRSNSKVMEYIGKDPAATMGDAFDFIQRVNDSLNHRSGITWAISLKDDPQKLVGAAGLWRVIQEHFRAEVGYMLLPEFWRNGIAREAIAEIIHYGFTRMNLHSVEAHINPLNIASSTLLERLGFVREGYFREDYFYNGVFEDTAIYSLLSPG